MIVVTSMAFEIRTCPECEGHGSRQEIGNGPHDRPYLMVCTRCSGSGEARVYIYERAYGLRERRGSYDS